MIYTGMVNFLSLFACLYYSYTHPRRQHSTRHMAPTATPAPAPRTRYCKSTSFCPAGSRQPKKPGCIAAVWAGAPFTVAPSSRGRGWTKTACCTARQTPAPQRRRRNNSNATSSSPRLAAGFQLILQPQAWPPQARPTPIRRLHTPILPQTCRPRCGAQIDDSTLGGRKGPAGRHNHRLSFPHRIAAPPRRTVKIAVLRRGYHNLVLRLWACAGTSSASSVPQSRVYSRFCTPKASVLPPAQPFGSPAGIKKARGRASGFCTGQTGCPLPAAQNGQTWPVPSSSR